MTRTLTAIALTATLTLAACTSDPQPSPSPAEPVTPTTTAAPTPSPTPAVFVGEGPAAAPAVWPDGLTARLTKLERMVRSRGAYTEPNQTLVRATVTITNDGVLPVPGDDGRVWLRVLYGADRYPADQDPGNTDSAASLTSRKPGRFAVGSTVVVFESFDVPTAQLGTLAVTVTLPAEEGVREPHTFTGAEALLK